MKASEIIAKYTHGEASLEETNAKLREIRAGVSLNPKKHVILPGEEARFGLLDTGTGTFDKVEIKDGKLVNVDCGDMYALVILDGRTYRVQGNTLVE